MTRHGRDLLPRLNTCWEAVTTAANSLDADLPFPLSQLLDLAIEALAKKPLETRIQAARQTRRISKKQEMSKRSMLALRIPTVEQSG
jgi:hypothetical protein